MPFGFRDIFLEEESNKDFFKLLEEHNSIIKDFDQLNKKIAKQYVPNKIGRKDKYIYDHFATKVRSYQSRMIEYENNTLNFVINPRLEFTKERNDIHDDLNFLRSHAVNVIATLRSEVFNSRAILTENYEGLLSEAENARNFRIAIHSKTLALIGLAISLIGLFISIYLSNN